jgi:hypothetical protein
MESGKIYIHKNFKDVVIIPWAVADTRDGFCITFGQYWNLGFVGRPWLIDPVGDLTVRYEQFLEDWAELPTNLFTKPRSEWWFEFRSARGWPID